MTPALTYGVWQYTCPTPRLRSGMELTLEEALAEVDEALAKPDVYEVHLICMKEVAS